MARRPRCEKIQTFVDGFWDGEILPAIREYIRVPNVSPHFDREWEKHGHMEKALQLVKGWVEERKPEGAPRCTSVGYLSGRRSCCWKYRARPIGRS